MDQSAREKFFDRIEAAPLAAQGFFETVGEHFQRRNDVNVHYTYTTVADLRLEAIWQQRNGKEGSQNFATMYWQTQTQRVVGRCYLTPDELAGVGFKGATKPNSPTEPLKSDLSLDEDVWRYRAQDFIRAMEAARIKMMQAKAGSA